MIFFRKNKTRQKLLVNSVIYITSDVINKIIPFILIPILTNYITPEEYGKLSLFNSVASFLLFVIGANVLGAVNTNYFKIDNKEIPTYIGNVFYILLASFVIFLIIIIPLNLYYNTISKLEYKYIIIAGITAFNAQMIMLNTNLWLVSQKSKLLSSYQIIESLVKLLFAILFVVVFSFSWEGMVGAILITSSLSAIVSFVLLIKNKNIKFSYNSKYIKDALNFGIPLFPHQISNWLRTGAIIFVLALLVGDEETGIYTIAMQLVMPIIVLGTAFNKTWMPHLYKKIASQLEMEEKIKIVKTTYVYILTIIVITVIGIISAPYLLDFILPKSYNVSGKFIPYLAFAAALQSIYLVFVNYIFFSKKTKYLSVITFSSSILQIVLAYYLVTKIGAEGAAIATSITAVISVSLVWYYSNKVYPMPWNIYKMFAKN